MDNNYNKSSSGGVGLLSVVQVVLIVLKLFDLIHISWVQVFIPTFIGAGISLLFLMIVGVVWIVTKGR